MIVSYKHLRIQYEYSNINIWINHTQYYRTLLRAHSICMPSIIQYMLVYSNNSNRIEFKSRQLANIIGKFVYNYVRFIKIYSYFYKLFKQVINTKNLKKVYNYKYIRNRQLRFTISLKHFILLIRNKIRIKLKKNRYYLWKLFYSIPNNFWNNMAKKRIKSIIWYIFFIRNQLNNKINKKYINKNEKIKGNLFFFSYNKISNLVYNTFNKKRIPKKEWLLKKNNEKKKKKKRKFGIHFYNNVFEDSFINITNNYIYNTTINKTSKTYNNKYIKYIYSKNNILVYMYSYLLFYIKLANINKYYLNLYYIYISYIYKNRISNSIIYTYNTYIHHLVNKLNAHNTFNFNIWYNLCVREYNTYTYFNINSTLVHKINLFIYNNSILSIKKNNYNIFFIKKNIIKNEFINNTINNYVVIDNNYKNYIKKSYIKNFCIKKNIHIYTTVPVIYKNILSKSNIIKKNIYNNMFKTFNILNKKVYTYSKVHIKKIINRRIFIRKFYNSFKKIIRSATYYKRNKYIITKINKLNSLFIRSYKTRLYNYYINKYIKKLYNYNNIKCKNIYNRLYKANNNININYKFIINSITNYKYTIYNNSIENKVGLDLKIMFNRNLLYLVYFNSNIIYKEIINEYNIRIHNKNNKYDHLFILHKNIIIFLNKKKNVGNIINGINLYTNCFYINNSNNYISLLYNINKYSKLLIIPIFNYINNYYTSINNY